MLRVAVTLLLVTGTLFIVTAEYDMLLSNIEMKPV